MPGKMTPHGREILCWMVQRVPPLAWCISFAHALLPNPAGTGCCCCCCTLNSSWDFVEPFLRLQTPMHVWESKCTACYGSGIVSFTSGRRGRRSSATCASCTGMGAFLSPRQLSYVRLVKPTRAPATGRIRPLSQNRRICLWEESVVLGRESPTTSLSNLYPCFHPVYVKDFS